MSAEAWAASRFTGLFTAFDRVDPAPHDPALVTYAGTLGRRGPQRVPIVVGGAGWSDAEARGACLGEALERFECWLGPADGRVVGTHRGFPLDEPSVPPSAHALFTEAQYASEGFPFARFDEDTETSWVAFRDVREGTPAWLPDAFATLHAAPGEGHGITPKISTGLAAGRLGDPVVLRGLQEVVERDAMVRAWWGEYPLEELDPARALAALPPDVRRRALRPHLAYRFFRVRTPHAAHAVLVTTLGEEQEGPVFSTGSACRETRDAAVAKALLEALQGRHYVRYQRALARAPSPCGEEVPTDFAGHVLYYTERPERLAATVLGAPMSPEDETERTLEEPLGALLERLGRVRPLFRLLTPRAVTEHAPGLFVVKVVAPGLVPLHGDHRFAHLDVPCWRDRPLSEWATHPPHPFA